MIIFEFLMEITDHVKAFVEELKAIPGVDRVDVNDNGVMVAASTKEAQEKCRLLYCKFCNED